jgi:hypothetical protein
MPKFYAGPRTFLREASEALVRRRYERIAVEPLSPTVGAEIRGVSLAEPLDDATFREIHAAFLDWKVIFFRDQGDLTSRSTPPSRAASASSRCTRSCRAAPTLPR